MFTYPICNTCSICMWSSMHVNMLISRRLAQYRSIILSITLVIPTQINLCPECELKRNLTNKIPIKVKYKLLSNWIHVHKNVYTLLSSNFLVELDYVTRETKNIHWILIHVTAFSFSTKRIISQSFYRIKINVHVHTIVFFTGAISSNTNIILIFHECVQFV